MNFPRLLFFAVIYFILSFVLLTLPGADLPEISFFNSLHIDKWIHVGMFGLLVLLWGYTINLKKPAAPRMKLVFILITLAAMGYGIGMEYIQKYFVVNRSFDIGDIYADVAGSIIGCIAGIYSYKKIDLCRNRGRNQN